MALGTRFNLGVCQLNSVDQVDFNLQVVQRLYLEAVAGKAQLVVFPENTLYQHIVAGLPLQGLTLNSPEFNALQILVDSNSVPMLLTTALVASDGKYSNSTVFICPNCVAQDVYHKIHLFDVDVPGAPPVRESAQFVAGSKRGEVEVEGWRFGLSICYDLRFGELYRPYAQEVDVILVPASFLMPTGEAHWEVLLRARAIENQCFVAAPAQAGSHQSLQRPESKPRLTYGHSMVVDPWGRVLLNRLTSDSAVDVVELDKKVLDQVRQQIPIKAHRRLS